MGVEVCIRLSRDVETLLLEVDRRSFDAPGIILFLRGPSWLALVAASEMDTGDAGRFVPEAILGVLEAPGLSKIGSGKAEGSGVSRLLPSPLVPGIAATDVLCFESCCDWCEGW